MRTAFLSAALLLQAAGTLAFPWMAAPGAEEATQNYLRERGLLDQLGSTVVGAGEGVITSLTGTLGDVVNGLSNALADGVKASDKRPEPGFEFKAPGPTDQRGPCPGLNTLANHGYLPRSGIVTATEAITATNRGFNMGADLSGLLALIAVAFGGNLATSTFSIGGEDARTYSASGIGSKAAGRQFGLSAHSRCEGDASATRADFFTNGGDNHNGQPDRFRRFMELAKKNGGEFGLAAANQLFAENAALTLKNNPQTYYQAYTAIVVLGEYPFLPAFMSNGTYGAGGVANLDSISSIMGYQINKDGSICYVPERFPDNWYRRATAYQVKDLIAGLPATQLAAPTFLPNPLQDIFMTGDIGQIGCELYQGLQSGIPASLLGSTYQTATDLIKTLQHNLIPGLPNLLNCDSDDQALQTNATGGGQYYDSSILALQATGPGGNKKKICSSA